MGRHAAADWREEEEGSSTVNLASMAHVCKAIPDERPHFAWSQSESAMLSYIPLVRPIFLGKNHRPHKRVPLYGWNKRASESELSVCLCP